MWSFDDGFLTLYFILFILCLMKPGRVEYLGIGTELLQKSYYIIDNNFHSFISAVTDFDGLK